MQCDTNTKMKVNRSVRGAAMWGSVELRSATTKREKKKNALATQEPHCATPNTSSAESGEKSGKLAVRRLEVALSTHHVAVLVQQRGQPHC